MSIKKIVIAIIFLQGTYGFTQSRSEIALQMSKLVNASSYSSDIQYYNNNMNADCSKFTHSFDGYMSVSFTQTEHFARTTDSYTNIPWKDFDFVGEDKVSGRIYVFFTNPIIQTHKVVFGPYFRKDHSDSTTNREVRSILFNIQNNDVALFHQLCRKLKRIDAALPDQVPVPATNSLPIVSYCQKILPPTKNEVGSMFFRITAVDKCEPEGWPSFQCDLYKLAGIDISAMSSEDVRAKGQLVADYWNKYCYSFSYKSHIGQLWNFETTVMETAEDVAYDTGVFLFIGYRLKANVNLLNPFTGMTYYDNIAGDYGEEEHSAEPNVEEIGHKLNALNHAKKRSGLPSTLMLDQIKYDEPTHTAVIEAVVCNSQGEGIFAGLRDDAGQFLLYMHNIGLRNFDEVIFLFEHIYNTKIPSSKLPEYRKTIGYRNMAWD